MAGDCSGLQRYNLVERIMSTLNPMDQQQLVSRATQGPVTMLNLLAFKPEGGAARYAEYGAAAAPLLARAGAKVVYMGKANELLIGTDGDRWDLVVLVEYPTRQAFLEMVSAPEYQAILPLREAALVRSVLLVTDPLAR